jgi:hypothetical protein
MAVKVVYDATRGLVQENDATGVGGFQIKDVSLTEGSDTFNAVATGAVGAAEALPATGVSLVTLAAGNDGNLKFCKLADGSAVGQQKTIIVVDDNAQGVNLTVKNEDNNATLVADGDSLAVGDVVVLVWDGNVWRVVNQTA